MTLYKKIILFSLVYFSVGFSMAQKSNNDMRENKYRAVHWNVELGLSHDKSYCILKDVNDFLWVGTEDGLSRFDGNIFRNYFSDPKKSKTIGGSLIQGLVEDSLHNIWIGTNKGLSRYDIKADTFSNFLPVFANATISNYITPFWATKDEVFCQETDFLITSYNIHSFAKKILIRLTNDDKVGYGYSRMHSIVDDQSRSIWMLEECNGSNQGGLLQITLSTGKRTHYSWPCYRNIPHHCHVSEGMCYDRRRNALWINSPDGLVEFTLSDKEFHHENVLNELDNRKDYERSVGIDIDAAGIVWFASYPKGIIIYDPDSRSKNIPFPRDSSIQRLVSDFNGSIYCDRDGVVWSGFWLRKGIYQLIPFSAPVTRYLGDTIKNHPWQNVISNCIRGEHGKVWMGTEDDGIIIFDPHAKKFETIRPEDIPGVGKETSVEPVLIDTIIHKALLSTKGKSETLYEMDIPSKGYKPVVFKNSAGQDINVTGIYACDPFRTGCMVSATYDENVSIFMVNLDSGVAHEMLGFPQNSIDGNLTTTAGNHLLFVKRPDILGDLTYSFLNNKWTCTANPLDSVQWSKIIYNRADKSYWVVVPRAILHYDGNFRLLHHYGVEDGLPYSEIFVLIPDDHGNVWFNTNRYVYQLNVTTGTINHLSEKDGFSYQDFRDVPGPGGMKYDNGDLYFPGGGTAQGFSVISPSKYRSNPVSVYLKSLEIRQYSLPDSVALGNLQQLSLKYFQNRIIIEPGVIDYFSQGKGPIRYKLEGRDEIWQYAPSNSKIRYEELPTGNYRLLIQAGNAGSEFTGQIKSLIIQISPAYWNTLWFRIITAFCIVVLFYATIRYRIHQKFRLRLQNSENEKQFADMSQKTAELKQQTTELEMQALRAQMNPHFIFNSLNSINRFILQNNRMQASAYLTKFSKLVRMILQNSQQALISLESELESLNLYLELESLRFDYHFSYKISYPQDLDISMFLVPPLIIQPYAENAIWHGLMQKEEKGQLDIEISQEDKNVYIRVSDNGIGRKRASEIASKSATKHKSLGLRITAHRIDMISSNSGNTDSHVTINDLFDEGGKAAGTEVILKIPVIYD